MLIRDIRDAMLRLFLVLCCVVFASVLRSASRAPLSRALRMRDMCSGASWLSRTCLLSDVCVLDGRIVSRRPGSRDRDVSTSIYPFHVAYRRDVGGFERIARVDPVYDSRTVKLPTVPGVSILFGEYNGENFGHVMNDSVLPWFRMMRAFGIHRRDIKSVVRIGSSPPLRYSCDDRVLTGKLRSRSRCDRTLNMFSEHLFGFKVHSFDNVCFDRILIGSGLLSDHEFDHSTHSEGLAYTPLLEIPTPLDPSMMREFRSFLLGQSSRAVDPRKVVIVPRSGPKGAANMHELVAPIGDLGYDVKLVDPSKMETLAEQIDTFADASVVIATNGGGSLIAQVAPDDATIILLSPRTSDHAFWLSLSHLDVRILPVRSGRIDVASAVSVVASRDTWA